MGDETYDAIYSMGFPWSIPIGGACVGSVWNDGVEVSELCVNEIKMLGLQDVLFLSLGTFEGYVLSYRWQ